MSPSPHSPTAGQRLNQLRTATLRRTTQGFTLIEVLVVVAIIALLVAILIPSLARARELAQITKCLANMSNLPKGVHTFSIEHKGYSQLIATEDEWKIVDPKFTKYDYQANMFGRSTMQLKPWPLAYARGVGEISLKRAEQYFTEDGTKKADRDFFFSKFGRHDIFLCPSDKQPIHNMWSPFYMLGLISYAANEDVFGITNPPGGSDPGEGQPWSDGSSSRDNPPRAKRLEGRMDRILDPSTVVLFSDGGREGSYSDQPCLLITNGAYGPYLENYEWVDNRLPHFRHLAKGGICTAMADGSGKLVKPLQWCHKGGDSVPYVKSYGPKVRISPYRIGVLNPANQPGPGWMP